jgi:twinkle protein
MTKRFTIVGTVGSPGTSGLSEKAIRWAKARGISQDTLTRLGVGSDTVWFPELNRKAEALIFHYMGGWKARCIEQKAHVSEKGFKLGFWNIAAVVNSTSDDVHITEGELDACALVEAGVPIDTVLSVPNGAKARSNDDDERELRGYAFVTEALAKGGLGKKKRFVWCGDMDDPGLSLRSDMAKLIGAARYRYVDWPEGCNDANGMLESDGAEALLELVTKGALEWPVRGIYRMSELPEPAPMEVWSTGMESWDGKIMLAPRTLSVVTGQPGHGKTLLMQQVFFQIARRYNLIAAIASFETRPKPHLRRQLRSLHAGILEKDMSDDDRKRADEFIMDHYRFIVHAEQRPSLEWFLEIAEVAVVREGAKIIQLDPWNRLEAGRDVGEMETEYIAKCLREIHAFANDLDCHVQIIAHPAKIEGKRRKHPPDLEDISGSKAWDAMVDQGIVVHRAVLFADGKRCTEADVYHRKARHEELGYQCMMPIEYNLQTGAYERRVIAPKNDK